MEQCAQYFFHNTEVPTMLLMYLLPALPGIVIGLCFYFIGMFVTCGGMAATVIATVTNYQKTGNKHEDGTDQYALDLAFDYRSQSYEVRKLIYPSKKDHFEKGQTLSIMVNKTAPANSGIELNPINIKVTGPLAGLIIYVPIAYAMICPLLMTVCSR